MNDPLNSLGERIKQSLTLLGQKLSALEEKKVEYVHLKESAASNDCKLANSAGYITIYLGDGYFVEKTRQQVIEYTDRRIHAIETMASSVTENVKSAEKALFDLTKIGAFTTDMISSPLEQEQPSEQELPIFDIQEELDEDGNIISSSVQPRTGSQGLDNLHVGAFSSLLNAMEEQSEITDSNRFEEIDVEKHLNGTDINHVNGDGQIKDDEETNGIHLNGTDSSHTRGSVSSDSERPKSILKSPRISEYSSDQEDSRSSRRKSVTFSETLDIVESEGSIQARLEDDEDDDDILNSGLNGYSISPEEMISFEMMAKEMEDEDDDYDDDDDDEYEEDEDEHGRTGGSFFPGISEEALKRIPFGKDNSATTKNESTKPKVSRFKASRMTREDSSNLSQNETSKTSESSRGPINDIIERTDNISLNSRPVSSRSSNSVANKQPVPLNIGQSNVLTDQEKEELKNASESTYGDMVPAGFDPEVFKKAMDYFLSSSLTEDEFVEAFGDDDIDESQDINGPESSTDRPIMGDITEHEVQEADNEDLDDENSVNMNEIAQEYQQMRQKFINRTGGFKPTEKEKEFEPIETEKKVSRFKAARLHRRD